MDEMVGLAGMLSKYGPWGLLVISGYVIRWLFLRYDLIQEKRIQEGIDNGATARACADALVKVHGVVVAADAQLAVTNERLRKYLHDEKAV